MTPMTLMTMNCRGSLKGVRHSAVESRDRTTGREPKERKCDKARHCSRPARNLSHDPVRPGGHTCQLVVFGVPGAC
jgi:hypothetical protein